MFEFLDPKVWLRFKTRASINRVASSGPFLFLSSNLQFSLTNKAAQKSGKRASHEQSPSKHAAAKTKAAKASTILIETNADSESAPAIDICKDINGAQAEERSTGDASNGANAVNGQNPQLLAVAALLQNASTAQPILPNQQLSPEQLIQHVAVLNQLLALQNAAGTAQQPTDSVPLESS